MGKKRSAQKINKKDLKHLKDFGELHPADVESNLKRLKFNEDKQLGTAQRRIIKAKSRLPAGHPLIPKVEKSQKSKPKNRTAEADDESDDESDTEQAEELLTPGDLLELLKRETDEERIEVEAHLADDKAELELEDELDNRDAEDTWKGHVAKVITDSDILQIDDKKSYSVEKLAFQHYNRCRHLTPASKEKAPLQVFDDLDALHIKERMQRNVKKMETREKELFSMFHQYKGTF